MLCENGTVQAVGGNQWGQLGNGTFDPSAFFTPVVGLDDVIQVSNAIDHTLALKCDGTVWAWGINSYGKVGSPILSASVNTPFQVLGITNAIKVSAGGYHSMALLEDGTVLCWGLGERGQLGNGAWADSYIPVVVTGLSNVIDISAGRLFSAALLNDGTVRTWGDNLWGQLGDGAWANSNIPVVVVGLSDVVKIATGETSAYSIATNGAIWAWGFNSAGQLGNGTTTDSNVPVQMLYSSSSYPIDIAACSIDCLILFDNGDIMACGDNTHCQFGADMPSNTLFPTLVLAATPFVDLVRSIAHLHVFGLTGEGAVYGWGRNMYGQIGLGTAGNNICTPTLVDIVCTAKVPACFDIESFYCQNEAITLAPTPTGGIVTVIPPSNNALVLNTTPYTFIPTETGAYTLVYEVETLACATEMVQVSTFVAPCCPPPIDDTPDVINSPQELACCLQNTDFLIHQNSNGLTMVYDNMAYTVQNSGT
ncbi:MAG TPA: hypothetical protein PK239_19095, partial [Chitinophagales bacterium]|nr:hypothetical protein [Chitinophagales bacterium]